MPDIFTEDEKQRRERSKQVGRGILARQRDAAEEKSMAGRVKDQLEQPVDPSMFAPFPGRPQPTPEAPEPEPKAVAPAVTIKPSEEIKKIKLNPVNLEEPPAPSDFSVQLADYKAKVTAAMKAYRTEKDEIKQRQMWDSIIKGLTMIAGGMYAMKQGIDISGLKLDQANYSDQFNNARAELDAVLGEAKTEYDLSRDAEQGKWREYNAKLQKANADLRKQSNLINKAAVEADARYKDKLAAVKREAAEAKAVPDAEKAKADAIKLIRQAAGRKGKERDAAAAEAIEKLKAAGLAVPENLTKEPGLIWDSRRSAEDIIKDIGGLGAGETLPKDPTAEAYANKYDMDYNEAYLLLKSKGYIK